MVRRIRHTGIGKELGKALQTNVVHREVDNLVSMTAQFSDGTAVGELKIGPYTYQTIQLAIRSKVDIPGKTFLANGVHYVNTANMAEYLDKVSLEIDGTVERELDTDLFIKLNAFRGFDATEGVLTMDFGGPNEFVERIAEDAYMLGTGDLRDVRLLYDLTSAWVDGSMFMEHQCNYAPVARPLEFIRTMKSYRTTFANVGPNTFNKLPVNADIARIYVFGAGLKEATLRMDDQIVTSGKAHMIAASNALYGRDIAALGQCILFDFWRTKEVEKGIKSFETAAHRKRNAVVEIDLEMANPDTEVRVVMELAGRYAQQA